MRSLPDFLQTRGACERRLLPLRLSHIVFLVCRSAATLGQLSGGTARQITVSAWHCQSDSTPPTFWHWKRSSKDCTGPERSGCARPPKQLSRFQGVDRGSDRTGREQNCPPDDIHRLRSSVQKRFEYREVGTAETERRRASNVRSARSPGQPSTIPARHGLSPHGLDLERGSPTCALPLGPEIQSRNTRYRVMVARGYSITND
jgi:hypothetical protein